MYVHTCFARVKNAPGWLFIFRISGVLPDTLFSPNTHSFPSSHPPSSLRNRVDVLLTTVSPVPDTQWKSTSICWINKNTAWEGEEMMKQNYEEFKVQNKENVVHIYIYI